MSTRESLIERKVVAWAKRHDIVPLKLTPVSDGGWPDRIWLFYYPAIAFIELKAPGKGAAPRQAARIAQLKARGYPVAVCDTYESAITFLEATFLSNRGGAATDKPSVRGLTAPAWNG